MKVGAYEVPDDRLYTETHEWLKVEGSRARVGVTDYAQRQLKDVVGVELPRPRARLKRGDVAAVIDSIKATAEVYAPVSGEVSEVNEELLEKPELINKDPYGRGWIFVLTLEDSEELGVLLRPEEYAEKIRGRGGG